VSKKDGQDVKNSHDKNIANSEPYV